jgi:hypothetical protein
VRWDPAREDEVFFLQAGHLYAQYYDVHAFIHRPFIDHKSKDTPGACVSAAICANAARLCAHIVDTTQRRFPGRILPFFYVRRLFLRSKY